MAVELLLSRSSRQTAEAIDALLRRLVSSSRGELSVRIANREGPWPHWKVLTTDGVAAYVGSANLTVRGLAEGNLEFGVLLRGDGTAVIDGILDSLLPSTRMSQAWPR